MLIGCLNLAGFPLTAGYFSKDVILAEAFTTPGYALLGWIALITAGLTAYYTFRVFFRVFVGPKHYEPGEDLHDAEAEAIEHEEIDEAHADHEHFHPHPPGWAINTALATLAIGSVVVAALYFVGDKGWVPGILKNSTAAYVSPYGAHAGEAHALSRPLDEAFGAQFTLAAEGDPAAQAGTIFGFDPHKAMYYISAIIGLIGIGFAWFLHYAGRTEAATSRADALKARVGWIGRAAERKWYVDEIYDALFRIPLLVFANLFYLFDALIIDGLVNLFGRAPRSVGAGLRPSQNGVLQGYATGMAGGVALLLALVWIVWVAL
jgi:NADH-quinone oxidoreductase subunit L